MNRYFAILYPGEDLTTCWRVAREGPGYIEKYHAKSDSWEKDPELFSIYTGSPETEAITEAEANEIINRIKARRERLLNSK